MNLESIPPWAWVLLAVASWFYVSRSGVLEGVTPPKPDEDKEQPGSLFERLKGSRTKLASLVLALLGVNEVGNFVPDQYSSPLLYLTGAAGLYFLRDAVARIVPNAKLATPVDTTRRESD